ncbi:hypothetical protein [Chitinophaga rhizophila]|uniref:Uncharacterized protein n=1 Tax=Chitinophaga rhizophila TaxID=2866212 RepID=A0ABS7GCE7_9BACT|nr:hypothetical protein [Chitinophaga rhizophila]MBW8684362.1 hypothetical protein [Chitinophaga rhizophila]
MLPESLRQILDTIDYVEYDIEILKTDISANPVKIDLLIRDIENYSGNTAVSMRVFNCQDLHINYPQNDTYPRLETECALLWPFTDTRCELYIAGGPSGNLEKIVFELLLVHQRFFGQYIAFNPAISILQNGYGLFAKGSKKLLMAYAHILNRNGVNTSIIGDLAPSAAYVNLQVLFIGGSYIIGDRFECEVVPITDQADERETHEW